MRRALALALALAGAACAPAAEGRAERLAGDLEARRALLARAEASERTALVAEAVELGLAELGDGRYLHLEGSVVLKREIQLYAELNGLRPRGAEAAQRAQLAIADYAQVLRGRGIDLLVVPIPRRLQLYPDRLPGVPEGEEPVDPGYLRLLIGLAELGVEVVDLYPLFLAQRHDDSGADDPTLIHDYNNHWTPRAAALAAQAIAARVRRLEGFVPGPKVEGRDFVRRLERVEYQLPRELPEAEEPVPVYLRRVLTPAGEPVAWQRPASSLLLLGDSNARWYTQYGADLPALLFAELGTGIDAIVVNGGGADAVWRAAARRGAALAQARVVVWVFAAEYLLDPRLEPIELFAE